MEKRFSIIIPVYNAEKYISRCIESVLKQTYKDFELIIVDDGSSDRSLELCRSYEAFDDRITVISKENKGVSSARNRGLLHATGRYVIFVDSDDAISPELCERLNNNLKQGKDNELIVFGYYSVSDDRKEEVALQKEVTFEIKSFAEALHILEESRLLYIVWNKVFVRSKINHSFPENMSFAEDSCFVVKYLEQMDKITVITFPGYDYYTNVSGSALKSYHKNMLENCLQEFDYIKACSVGDGKALLKHARKHLCDNFWYFIFPSLIRTKEFSKAEKKYELKRIMDNKVLQSVLYCDGFERKIQKLMLSLSRVRLFGLMLFLYGRVLRV